MPGTGALDVALKARKLASQVTLSGVTADATKIANSLSSIAPELELGIAAAGLLGACFAYLDDSIDDTEVKIKTYADECEVGVVRVVFDPHSSVPEWQIFKLWLNCLENIKFKNESLGMQYSGIYIKKNNNSNNIYTAMPLGAISRPDFPDMTNAVNDAVKAVDSELKSLSKFIKSLPMPKIYYGVNWFYVNVLSKDGENYPNDARFLRMILTSMSNILWNLLLPVNLPDSSDDDDTVTLYDSGDRDQIFTAFFAGLSSFLDNPQVKSYFSTQTYKYVVHANSLITEKNRSDAREHINKILHTYLPLIKTSYLIEASPASLNDVNDNFHNIAQILLNLNWRMIFHVDAQTAQDYVEATTKILTEIKAGLCCDVANGKKLMLGLNEILQTLQINKADLCISSVNGRHHSYEVKTFVDVLILWSHLDAGRREKFLKNTIDADYLNESSFKASLKEFDEIFRPKTGLFKHHTIDKMQEFTPARIIRLLLQLLEFNKSSTNIDMHDVVATIDAQIRKIHQAPLYQDYFIDIFTKFGFAKDLPDFIDLMHDVMRKFTIAADIVEQDKTQLSIQSFKNQLDAEIQKAKEILCEGWQITQDAIKIASNKSSVSEGAAALSLAKIFTDLLNYIQAARNSLEVLSHKLHDNTAVKSDEILMENLAAFSEIDLPVDGVPAKIHAEDDPFLPVYIEQPADINSIRVLMKSLMQDCKSNVSMSSYLWGRKWGLLLSLEQKMDQQAEISKHDLQVYFNNLARLAFSYQRNFCFFHANYGETSTAQGFLKALSSAKYAALKQYFLADKEVSLANIKNLHPESETLYWQENIDAIHSDSIKISMTA
jgi:hypothetical protein